MHKPKLHAPGAGCCCSLFLRGLPQASGVTPGVGDVLGDVIVRSAGLSCTCGQMARVWSGPGPNSELLVPRMLAASNMHDDIYTIRSCVYAWPLCMV